MTSKIMLWDLGDSDALNAGHIDLGEKHITTPPGKFFGVYMLRI